MPRTISSGLDAALQSGAIALSILVRLDRADGVSLGFTTAGSSITFGGLTYEPGEGVGTSAIQATAGSGVDNMDVAGVLSSARIKEDDLARGLYDGAKITVYAVDRSNLANGAATLLVGYLGDIEIQDGQFRTEVRSLSARLKQTVGDVTSKVCRCPRVGDACCRLNMNGTSNGGWPNRVNGRSVASVSADQGTIVFGGDNAPSGHYSWGVLKFTTGQNAGVSRDVKIHANVSGQAQLTLRQKFPFPVAVGDLAQIDVGCDRLFTTCQTKFGNANNFRGEWFLPGNDTIIQVGRQ